MSGYATREDAEMAEAEDRADQRRDFQPEPTDQWGRDADWHQPRGYGDTP